jgi:hypothetical protein
MHASAIAKTEPAGPEREILRRRSAGDRWMLKP